MKQAEVDFVVEQGLNILPIEVKSNLSSAKLEANMIGFIKRYNPPKALIVNLGYQGKRKIGKTEIFFIYPFEIADYV